MKTDDIPMLAVHVRRRTDPVNGSPLLLYPEGVLELSATAEAMLDLCDGERNIRKIAEILSLIYEASEAAIEADLIAFLEELSAKGFLKIKM